jgi:glucose/arabinose dehydrogenase
MAFWNTHKTHTLRTGTRRSRTAASLAIAAGLILAACGDDDTSSSDPSAPETTAVETTVAPTTIPDLPTPDALEATQVMKARKPLALVERSPDDDFVYVVERDGYITRFAYDGTKLAETLDIAARTKASVEGGLLGLAFLKVDSTWYAYVNYTDREVVTTIIDEYKLDSSGDFIADTRRTVMTFEQPYKNHNGGDLKIGPDNMLYIASGDGGDGGDPKRYSMKTDNVLGKILRIDPAPTATTRNADSYNIPADNPFVGFVDDKGNPARGEIWSIGVRNPWRIDIDDTGTLWIADVGQNRWEEISMAAPTGTDKVGGKGANFGWSAFEGTNVMNPEMKADNHTPPVFEYDHNNGGCSVSGGTFVKPTNIPALRGWYLFSDSCHGKVAGIKVENGEVTDDKFFTEQLGSVVAVQQTSRGVFALTYGGAIYRLSA